jgi:hypothetical protein
MPYTPPLAVVARGAVAVEDNHQTGGQSAPKGKIMSTLSIYATSSIFGKDGKKRAASYEEARKRADRSKKPLAVFVSDDCGKTWKVV